MAVNELLARDFAFHLNTGTSGSPVWVEVKGIDTWSHSPAAKDADTTTFDDDGWETHMKASRTNAFSLKGKRQEDVSGGARDAGQDAVETWAKSVGLTSIKQFRITTPGSHTLVFDSSAVVTQGGGGNDDPSAWGVDLAVSGQIVYT